MPLIFKRRTQNPKNVTVSLSPWTDQDEEKGVHFSLFRLHVQESIYGEIPSGEAELIHKGKDQEALDMIQKQETGTVEIQDNKEGGLLYKFNIFITKRKFYNEILSIEFVCIPGYGEDKDTLERGKQFYTKLLSESYPNIEAAIDSSYPGKKIKRVDTNISDKTTIYRDNETSCDFVRRLCYSWKNDCVFAFGWDGLLIKEIVGINSFEDREDDNEKIKRIFGDQKEWTQLSKSSLKYNVKNNTKLFNPWQDPYKDIKDKDLLKSVTPEDKYKEWEKKRLKNVTSSINGERKYFIHGKDYYLLEENRKSCEVFAESKGFGSIVLLGRDMPREWELGDVIMYTRKKDDETYDVKNIRFIVASNELFFSQNGSTKTGPHGLPFEWTTTLWKVEDGPWSKELEENEENKES